MNQFKTQNKIFLTLLSKKFDMLSQQKSPLDINITLLGPFKCGTLARVVEAKIFQKTRQNLCSTSTRKTRAAK